MGAMLKDGMTIAVVIVAAGRGERAGASAEGPKQYRAIGGRPVIEHTLSAFLHWPRTGEIVVVIHQDDAALFAPVAARLEAARRRLRVVFGGPTRQHSVLAGLEALEAGAQSHVMIHDAVRPFVDTGLFERIAAALETGAVAVLPALAVADTLKRGEQGMVTQTVPRTGLFAAQTPQAFAFGDVLAAHRAAGRAGRDDFTDDAAIAEWAGLPVALVEGAADNVKLTLKQDIAMADERLNRALPDIRTGNGYDVHRLVAGNGVTLCGVFIAHDRRLDGHSDADVALHALTDALLATCGAGDIGDHFPPSDPQWKGAASGIFLRHAAELVRKRGGTIMNADISLIAEAPRIGPHRLKMRETLADMLAIAVERCSVKATTNEEIGFVGRREGIAAIATATVMYKGGSA